MYKTSKVIIKNDFDSIEPLVGYLNSISSLVGLSKKETQRLSYALEESLQNTISFDFESGSEEDIEVEISQIASGLRVSISDNGIPKNPFKKVDQSLDEMVKNVSFESLAKSDGDDISALSDFVIHKLLDKYRYINKGKDGRSIEMTIYASNTRIDENLELQQAIEEDRFELIRVPTSEDITGISRLFYKSYGYSYVNDLVYYPDRLINNIEDNSLISKVAISQQNRVIGHIALMQPFEGAKISEWGMAISDPVFRGQGIMSQLISKIMHEAKGSSYHGIFSHSVTNHEFTQKICVKYGFSDVALLVGYAGSELSFRNITNSLTQRESTIISYIALKKEEIVELFMPKKHEQMITKLYDGIGIKVRQKAPSKREITPLKTQIVDTIIPAINIAEIILQSIASDALDLVKFLTKKFSIAKIDITYIYLDLEDENLPDLVESLEEMGYIFAGIFPHYHHDNALVFQFINNLKFDYSLIQSYTPLAKELRDYICSQDPNQINE
ncbi:MAG: GNAT family N-acetyltransferase [Sulfurimonas sp.]|uniref:GNAT family N-acetyltransferase n=1 Tax=Sulfurimonas sp. TaxID=2022749 RepID=UPI0025F49DF1|nr:GNAT family N-acetyltransferase [Sulfurimonas sp.]MCK9490622.1 GNAT family N-acetyltransferase [Sulfurimonas sp.]